MALLPITLHSDAIASMREALEQWFDRRGFQMATFQRGRFRVSTGIADGMVVFRLRERPGSVTWYKLTGQGALIVFELGVGPAGVAYEGYCPLLLFGVWERKLRFKQDAGGLFAYRAEGWRIEQAFRERVDELERAVAR